MRRLKFLSGEIWIVEGKEIKLSFGTSEKNYFILKKVKNIAFLETVQFTTWRQIAELYL